MNQQQFSKDIEELIEVLITSQESQLCRCINFNQSLRKTINSNSNGKKLCVIYIKDICHILLKIFQSKFEASIKVEVKQFFDCFEQYIDVVNKLSVAIYHILYNLRAEKDFNFLEVAIAMIVKKNEEMIQTKVFQQTILEIEKLYKSNEEEQAVKICQRYLQHLYEIEENQIIQERGHVKLFELFLNKFSQWLKQYLEQKYNSMANFSIIVYFTDIQQFYQRNDKLLNFLQVKKYDYYQLILRQIFEKLVFGYQPILLDQSKSQNFFFLLEQYFTYLIIKPPKKNKIGTVQNILQIIVDLNSKFDDQEKYFDQFKQKFQNFVKENINFKYSSQKVQQTIVQNDKSLFEFFCELIDNYNQLIKLFKSNYQLKIIVEFQFQLFFENLEYDINITGKLVEHIHTVIIRLIYNEDKTTTLQEIEKQHQILLPIIKDYDLYMMDYQYQLVRRLIAYKQYYQDFTYYFDIEMDIILQMQQYSGQKKVKKLISMINEIGTESVCEKSIQLFDEEINIILLKSSKWPTISDENIFKELQVQKQQLLNQIKDEQKIIRFSDSLSIIELEWKETNKILIINCVQAAIVFLYNFDDSPKTTTYIKDQIQLPLTYIQLEINKLVKVQILYQINNNEYVLNTSFIEQQVENKSILTNIPEYYCDQQVEIYRKQNSLLKTEEDLKPRIQCAILKLLKSNKILSIQKLSEGVNKYLRPIEITFDQVKNHVEFLINQEYIERDQFDSNNILYKP